MYHRYCYLKSEGICSNQGDVVKLMCFFVLSNFEINLKFEKYHFKLILNPFL